MPAAKKKTTKRKAALKSAAASRQNTLANALGEAAPLQEYCVAWTAARAAASFMAKQLGEGVGETVGYRIRFESKVSARTRIEVVTEGILTRMLQDDPMLEGIGALLFDEFHERHLAGDLGLALALDVQAGLREDLRLVVMSATLDGEKLAAFLDAPRLSSAGRSYPVRIAHFPTRRDEAIEHQVKRAVELLTPAAASDHWDVIEGQGSLFHPSYAGVTLSLLHGAQAEAFMLCHDPRRRHIDYLPDYPIPDIEACIELHVRLGSLTRPGIRCAGISLNTAGLPVDERERWIEELARRTGLPVTDPIALGVGPIVDRLLRHDTR